MMAHFAASVFEQESHFNPRAVSNANCVGIGQLNEQMASHYGATDRTNASQNIDASVHFLADNLKRWGRLDQAAAEYHAGYSAVAAAGGDIPNTSDGGITTRAYTKAVLRRMARFINT